MTTARQQGTSSDNTSGNALVRQPVVADRFYPANPAELTRMVEACLQDTPEKRRKPTLLAMAPHAGYIFSGGVAGYTLGQANLPKTIFLLGPNHTGRGAGVSVWPEGAWRTPLGDVPVDASLAAELCGICPQARPDTQAHLGEHSLEVLLPFLLLCVPDLQIVPVAIGDSTPDSLHSVGEAIAAIISQNAGRDEFRQAADGRTTSQEQEDGKEQKERRISMVVSSDMTHFESRKEAERLDSMALEQVAALNPEGLYNTVRQHNISMCGVLPMTAAMVACRILGATRATLTRYATSGDITGDESNVVGYAGALVDWP